MTEHPRCELCADRPFADGVHCWTHDYEEGDPPEGCYRCRHCTALGRECDDCDGSGMGEADAVEDGTMCSTCEGWGVIGERGNAWIVHRRRRAH